MDYYLSLAALIPAVILFVRIYQLDRIEKRNRAGCLERADLCAALSAYRRLASSFCVGRWPTRTEPALGGVLLLDNFSGGRREREEICKMPPCGGWPRGSTGVRLPVRRSSIPCPPRCQASRRWKIFCTSCSQIFGQPGIAGSSVRAGTFLFAVAMGLLLSRSPSRPKNRETPQADGSYARWRCSSQWCCTGSGILSCRPEAVSNCRVLLLCGHFFYPADCGLRRALPRRTPACKGMFWNGRAEPGGSVCSPPGFLS